MFKIRFKESKFLYLKWIRNEIKCFSFLKNVQKIDIDLIYHDTYFINFSICGCKFNHFEKSDKIRHLPILNKVIFQEIIIFIENYLFLIIIGIFDTKF